MSRFANAAAFSAPRSMLQAMGADLSATRAIVDAQGHVLAYARTGGMIDPLRHELHARDTIYRFGSSARSTKDVAVGGWWLQRQEFELLLRFANTHDIFLGLAMRLLCLVPPEWSDAGVLVRARVARPLLAWRGLANSVVTPAGDGRGAVRMPHQNEISARRVHQLYIPGLADIGTLDPAISVEQDFHLDPRQARQGFLYL
jgi:hypothetical protein